MTPALEAYLVGGAVRDRLLGRVPGDRDWVVVGATAQQLLAMGYVRVGRDFPVFLHPQTQEEYALARTERKHGLGHRGFEVDAAPSVTLEEDLARRDLTINAIAEAADGRLIDPFGGCRDLTEGRLRHVSSAFGEDPLRVFRVARFAATLPDFEVAAETLELMRAMAAGEELGALSAERVWQELNKALQASAPHRFFQVLADVGALRAWFKELDGARWAFRTLEPLTRYAELPLPAAAFATLATRLKVPGVYARTAMDWSLSRAVLCDWQSAPAAMLSDVLQRLNVAHDALRLERLVQLMTAYGASAPEALLALSLQWREVRISPERRPLLQGTAFGAALREERVRLIDRLRPPLS